MKNSTLYICKRLLYIKRVHTHKIVEVFNFTVLMHRQFESVKKIIYVCGKLVSLSTSSVSVFDSLTRLVTGKHLVIVGRGPFCFRLLAIGAYNVRSKCQVMRMIKRLGRSD